MRMKTRAVTLPDQNSGSSVASVDSPSIPKVKSNLKQVIELTQQQEPAPGMTGDSPKEEAQQEMPFVSSWKNIKGCLKCVTNCWKFWCTKPTRVELDVNDADFADVISQIRSKKSHYPSVLPPQRHPQKVLVLDLDETLIHTSFTKPQKYDYESEVMFNGKSTKIYTIKRFGLQAFLFEMSKLYEIVIFTASQKMYADKVIDMIDPKKRVSHRLYRDNCIVINKTYYLKNLKILGRDMNNLLIVDDNSIAGILHPDNFYRIEPFDGNPKDRQLCRLSAFLKHIHSKSEMLPVGGYRKKFEDMEINLEEAVISSVVKTDEDRQGRSLNMRKKKYRHKKVNSEVEALVTRTEQQSEQAQTTTGELVTGKVFSDM